MKKQLLYFFLPLFMPFAGIGQTAVKQDSIINPTYLDLKKVKVAGTGQASLINSIDLKLRPVNSSQEVLTLVPGLFIAQHAGGGKAEQIFLRGFDVDHGTDFAINVDGIPVNMTSHAHGQGYADLHFLIPETIESLQVTKGPHDAQDGDLATAGSGSFRTKNNLDNNLFKMQYGSFGTKRVVGLVNISPNESLLPVQSENLYVAGSYKYTDAYFNVSQNFNRLNFFSKYTATLNNGDNISFSGSSFYSNWDASGQIPIRKVSDGTINRFGAIDPTEGGTTSRTNLNLKYRKKIGSHVLSNQLYYSKYDFKLYSNFTFFLNDSIKGDQISQVDDRNLMGFNSQLKSIFTLGNKAVLSKIGTGVRVDKASLELNRTEKRAFLSRSVYGNLDQANAWVFVDESIYLNPKLKLNLGLRTDVYRFAFMDRLDPQNSGIEYKAITNPKLNVDYSLNENTTLSAKSGFGFHSNDARSVVLGRLENSLARAFGNEIGITAKPYAKTFVNVALWSLDLENELVYVGDEGVVEIAGATRRYGLDFGIRQQIGKQLFFDLDVNYNYARLIEAQEGENHIPLAPTLTSIGGLTYQSAKGLSASFRYRYMADRAANEDYSLIAKGYLLSDATIAYPYKRFTFSLNAQNLMNTQWEEAQFATQSRLRNEPQATEEIHFTPGAPFSLMMIAAYTF